jgi:hypothetical protein
LLKTASLENQQALQFSHSETKQEIGGMWCSRRHKDIVTLEGEG